MTSSAHCLQHCSNGRNFAKNCSGEVDMSPKCFSLKSFLILGLALSLNAAPTPTPTPTPTPSPSPTPSVSPVSRPTKTELTLMKFEPPHGSPGDRDYRSARLSYRINVPNRTEFPTINFSVETSSGKIFERIFTLPT